MVFIHGWGGSARYWRSTARALVNHFDCLLYDLRGFGQSQPIQQAATSRQQPYEMQDYAEDLANLLDALALNRVYLNSHSMGASVAALFVAHYPNRVERAILNCNGIFEYDSLKFKNWLSI